MPKHVKKTLSELQNEREKRNNRQKDIYSHVGININKDSLQYAQLLQCMEHRKITSFGKYARLALLRMIENDINEINAKSE